MTDGRLGEYLTIFNYKLITITSFDFLEHFASSNINTTVNFPELAGLRWKIYINSTNHEQAV